MVADNEQKSVLDLAVKQRCVSKECHEEKKIRREQRQKKMLTENAKRRALEKKSSEEKQLLTQSHLITSSEVREEPMAIDKEKISEVK